MAKRKTVKVSELERFRNRLLRAEKFATETHENGGSEFNEGYLEAVLDALSWFDLFMEEVEAEGY